MKETQMTSNKASTTKTMYLRNAKGHAVGCVVSRRVNSTIEQDLVEYEISVLNPVDKFNRKLGREIALGRLNTHPRELHISCKASGKQAARQILADIGGWPMGNSVPNRAIKAALTMLLAD